MRAKLPRKPRPPLDDRQLQELAIAYVGRFATSRAKLASYLQRKLRERGWAGDGDAPVAAIVERAAAAGYIDDAAYALGKARSLTGRGYGERRVSLALHAAGIEAADGEAARALAAEEAVEAALRFARRRRLGPFAESAADSRQVDKALAAMVRAGHPFALARSIIAMPPGATIDHASLALG